MIYQKMPFGKFKGHLLEDIETNYLVYAVENFTLPNELINKMKIIISDRLNIDSGSKEIDVSFIRHVYRDLVKKYHPDKGGSSEAFRALTEFKDSLL